MNRSGSSRLRNDSWAVSETLFSADSRTPKEKWGRPCGRPHSHRRVGPEGHLTPGVSMPVPRSSCEHSKSASIRPALAPAPVPSGAGIDREDLSLPPGGSETISSAWVSSGSREIRRFREFLDARPAIRPSDFAPSRLQRSGIWSAPGRTFVLFRFSFLHRAASRRRVVTVPKSLLRRRPFGLCLGRANPRLDDWKVRCLTDSGNSGTAQLSTFGLNASGQPCITQRFVAEWADYPRSRCPSSLSRSALSLIKPAASCWS